MRLCLLICTFFLPVIFVIAQQPYNHYTIRNGLPTNSINSIIQDNNGIIWIATNCGAVKYNGQFFKTFDIEKGLKTNDVFDIIPGADGRIYIMDYAEDLNYLYHDSVFALKTGRIRLDFINEYGPLNYFIDINRHKDLYIIRDDSFYNAHIAMVIDTAVSNKTSSIFLSLGYPYSIVTDTGKIYTFNIVTRQLLSKELPELKKFNPQNWQDRNGIFTASYGNRFFLFNPEEQKLKQVGFDNIKGINYNLKQIILAQNNIQITTENGLLVYNKDLELIDSFRINTREQAITSIFKDNRNNIWLVTAGNGLKFIDNYYRATLSIARPEQTVIEFSNEKLYTVNAKGDIVVMDANGMTISNIPVNSFSNTPSNLRHIYILNTDKGTIIATPKNISLINGLISTNYLKKITEEPNYGLQSIKGMCYSENKLYVLLHNGIYSLNKKQELSRIATGRFTKMAVVNDSSLWSADNNRLYRLRKDAKGQFAIEEFRLPDKELQALNEPGSMQADTCGNLLLTYDNYFVCYNARENKINYRRYENKIRGGRLCGSKLFVYTDGYIDYYVVNKASGTYKLQNRLYNFDYSLYEEIKGLTASDSNLYISNTNGIVITPLNNRLIPDSGFINKTFVTSITHKNKIFNRADTTNSISLLYTQGQTIFHVSSMSLSYGRDVSYRYFLEGLDEKWQTGISPNISYTGLPVGHYIFHFVAQASKYDLQGTEHIFTIDIEPLWWQRGELQFSGLLLLLGVSFWGVLRLVIARKNKQLQHVLIEKQISDVRLGTLQAQMNPHFVFNALTSVQSFLKQGKNELAGDYLLKFTQLVRLYLEFSRTRFISLKEDIKALQLYTDIESNRFNNKFIVRYQLEGIPADPEVLIPPMIIQPFVENAIVHGLYHKTDGPGLLLIMFSVAGNLLTVTIDDNGIGRKRAEEINKHYAKVPSRGNEIVDERIKILAEQEIMFIEVRITDKTDDKGNPAGTRVTIVFNIKSMSR